MNYKTLIIGGSGFVGSVLIDKLGTLNTRNFDKNQSPFFQKITVIGNVLNKNRLDEVMSGVDKVVLLAAEHRDDVSPVSLYYDVNVQGTKNVLDAMDKHGVKELIFTSSVAIYGLNKDNPNEHHREDPFNHYGKSKWNAEQVIKSWYQLSPAGKFITIIRPTVIFGERNRGNVYNLLNQIASKRFILIGSGANKKSMAYVGNVVAFIINRLNHADRGLSIFNYVDKPDFTMTELVSAIEDKLNIRLPKTRVPFWIGMLGGYSFDFISYLTGKKLPISSIRIRKFCATTQFDATKVAEVFEPPFTLKQGLERTLEFEFLEKDKDQILFFSE